MSPSGVFTCVSVLLLSSTITTDGYYYSRLARCSFSSFNLSDIVFTDSYIFGKRVQIEFNSSLGLFVGYTKMGKGIAAYWNKISIVEASRAMLGVCKVYLKERIYSYLSKTVEPKVKLMSLKHFVSTHTAMLMCSAYNFYPKYINITWLRDGKKVTGDVTYTEEMADGDWYYQSHAYLEYNPKPGEKISCMVEHSSFTEPRIYEWDPSLPGFQKIRIAVGATGILLGTVTAAAGLIYYRRHHRGWFLAPH